MKTIALSRQTGHPGDEALYRKAMIFYLISSVLLLSISVQLEWITNWVMGAYAVIAFGVGIEWLVGRGWAIIE